MSAHVSLNLLNDLGKRDQMRGSKWRILVKTPLIHVRLSLIFPLILIRFAWGLKQIPRKNESNTSTCSNFRTKIWLKIY